MRGGQYAGRRRVGVVAAEGVERGPPQLGVFPVVVARQIQADAAGFGQQWVEMTGAGRRDHALGAEKEDEAAEGAVVFRQGGGLEALESILVVSLVVEPDLMQVGDEIPVAFQVDGVAQRLIDGGLFSPGEGAVERVARPLAFEDGGDPRPAVGDGEAAEGGVGELAVHLDGRLALDCVVVGSGGGAGVAEDLLEDFGKEIAQEFRLLHRLRLFGGEQFRPVRQLDSGRRGRRTRERGQPGPQRFGTE